MAGVGGEGPDGLKKRYESLSIGFQVNRAIRIEHIMNSGWDTKVHVMENLSLPLQLSRQLSMQTSILNQLGDGQRLPKRLPVQLMYVLEITLWDVLGDLLSCGKPLFLAVQLAPLSLESMKEG
jgi:hypothetical protein